MSKIHALSDIHGHATEFALIVNAIDLDAHPGDSLVLLGDYIDRGPDSAKCLYLAKELSERYPERVTVLLGNHETDFLDWLGSDADAVDWLLADHELGTVRSFLSRDDLLTVGEQLTNTQDFESASAANGFIQGLILAQHRELLAWLRARPLHYETPNQIYVHAGIDEEAGEDWKAYTPDHLFVQKFPAQFGPFHKRIIAGHVGTSGMHGDGSHAPYFDGQAHWYIDGSVESTGRLNVLTYDTDTGAYDHFTAPSHTFELVMTSPAAPEQYDVLREGHQVGYLRMRHGHFSAYYPDHDGTLIYSADISDDFAHSSFKNNEERGTHIRAALTSISTRLIKAALTADVFANTFTYTIARDPSD